MKTASSFLSPLVAALLAALAPSALAQSGPANRASPPGPVPEAINVAAGPEQAASPSQGLDAAQKETAAALIAAGLEDETGWTLLESLTTEIGPRLGGTEGEARAREWGVRKLKSLGFKNVRIEPFDLPVWRRIEEEAAIVSPFPQKLHATALGFSVGTPADGIEGEVVRFSTLAELRAAPMEGFEGKIVFVDEPMTRTQDGSGYGPAVAKRSGAASEAARRGALGSVIRSVGTDSHRNPHTGMMRYEEGLTPVPAIAISNPDADQLARALRLADGPVVVSMKVSVDLQPDGRSGNVIGEIPGQTDDIVLVGGHLDAWDLGAGAVDDGAGIAITTAAAKLVGDLKGKPKRTIRVIMWGAEETGLIGARAYAEAHKEKLGRHVFASESDFGAGRVWRFDSGFGEGSVDKAPFFEEALAPLGVIPGNNNAFGGPDVTPLRQAGVPVASLRQDGTDYFDLHHTPDDTLDKVDPEALQQNIAAWAAMIYLASEIEGGFR